MNLPQLLSRLEELALMHGNLNADCDGYDDFMAEYTEELFENIDTLTAFARDALTTMKLIKILPHKEAPEAAAEDAFGNAKEFLSKWTGEGGGG